MKGFDLAIATPFFEMLKNKGVDVEVRDYSGKQPFEKDFDPINLSIIIKDSYSKPFIAFDFNNNEFGRISGYDSSGAYRDEVDGKKYS